MSTKRAVGEAVIRAIKLWAVVAVVVMIGLILFYDQRPPGMPEWLWHLRQAQASIKLS